MPPLPPIVSEASHVFRSLRRARAHAAATVLTVALGVAAALPLVAAARAGLAWKAPRQAPSFARAAGAGGGWTHDVRSITDLQLDGVRVVLCVVMAAGLLVLAATCMNAGALVLTRASARRHERALKAALGAGPARLLAHALAEGAVLALAGSALGAVIGIRVLRVLQSAWPGLPVMRHAPDAATLAIAIVIPCVVVVLFTVAPVLGAGRGNLHEHLSVGARATPGRYDAWFRRVLAIAQLTASMALLVGAGVLIRGSMPGTAPAGPGFDPRDTLTLRIDTPRAADGDALGRALAAVRALPGVRAASLATAEAPLGLGPADVVIGYCRECFSYGMATPVITATARNVAVGPGWFSTLRVPMVRGREIGAGDAGERVVVIDRALADRLFRYAEPVGKTVAFAEHGPAYRVIGVAGQVAPRGTGTPFEPAPTIYLPALIHPPSTVTLAVRAAGRDPLALAPGVSASVERAVPGATVSQVMTMEARLARYAAPLRWFAAVLAAVAAAALLLCAGGVYGVVAYGVERRRREIGVRMALGATAGQVVRHVVGGGARLAGRGMLFGAMAALGTAQSLAVLFRGVPIIDAATWIAVPALLAAVTVAASWVPARRAARIDPAAALASE